MTRSNFSVVPKRRNDIRRRPHQNAALHLTSPKLQDDASYLHHTFESPYSSNPTMLHIYDSNIVTMHAQAVRKRKIAVSEYEYALLLIVPLQMIIPLYFFAFSSVHSHDPTFSSLHYVFFGFHPLCVCVCVCVSQDSKKK